MDLREQFASVIKRGQNLPVDVVVEMLFGVLREQEPAGYANGDELANMLNDRSALLWPCRDNWRTVPLYAAPVPPVPPAESAVPEGWRQGVAAVAEMIQKKADDYAQRFGHDDAGGLSFGHGSHAEVRMDHYTGLLELADEVRAMLAAALKPAGIVVSAGHSVEFRDCRAEAGGRVMDHRMTQKEIDEALVLAMEADKREIERLRAELAASQAREKVRIEALENIGDSACGEASHQYVALRALAIPADDTALRAALDQRERETIERCAKAFSQWDREGRWAASVIRALEVKL